MNFKKIGLILLLLILIATGIIYVRGFEPSEPNDVTEEVEVNKVEEIVKEKFVEKNNEGDDELLEEVVEIIEENWEPDFYEGEFELPIEGAAGYTSIDVPLFLGPSWESETNSRLEAGTPFMIKSEEGNWWQIKVGEETGWIEHKYALINLPDIIPSIIYNNTNSYSAIFKSSYQTIPDLTDKQLYQAIDYNERHDKAFFIMPILYATAKKVNAAQKIALASGEGLILYETFRPYDVQQLIVKTLSDFASSNKEIDAGLNEEPWNQTWFIITDGISNHQVGAAMDVSLVTVHSTEERQVGDYLVKIVTDYSELEMQTPMHELSVASVIFDKKIPSKEKELLLAEPLNVLVTEPTIRLHQYAKEAGFTPIASEWWHFNDLDAVESLGEMSGQGKFRISETMNQKPLLENEQ